MKNDFNISYFFWEARKDKNGLIPVYIKSKQNSDKQFSYNTGEKLRKDQWNKVKNQPKNKSVRLIELEAKLQATYRDLLSQGFTPTLGDLVEHKNDARRPTNKNLISWCDDYLNGSYSEGQKKAVRTLKSNIEDFNASLTFNDIKTPRIKAFFEWLTKRGVANNSQYKRLRALINVTEHANLTIPDLKNFKFQYKTVNARPQRLTWSEVKAVIDTDANTHIEQVAKDVFLLACFSGLRIEDILTLNDGDLHEFYYERIQQKTKAPVMVTIHQYNEDLFKKYISDGVGYARQSLSHALKPLLKRSGLTKEVKHIQPVGNDFKTTAQPKYKKIAFHSGRRFYSRVLNDLGCGGEIARDELGHGYRSVTELYSGSQEHKLRIIRVRRAFEGLEKTMEELALMKVA